MPPALHALIVHVYQVPVRHHCLSPAGYIEAHNLMATRLDPHYGYQPESDSWLRLDDEVLQEAAQNLSLWRAGVQEKMHEPLGMPRNDPLGGCFVCAKTYKNQLDDGKAAM